jgi:hypothetical protein
MKKLYKLSCSGRGVIDITTFDDIYVIADDMEQASEKALAKMKELKYDMVDDFVSSIMLVADEQETNKCLLII